MSYMKKYRVTFTGENGKVIYTKDVETCGGKKSAIKMAEDHSKLPFSSCYYVKTTILK